MRPQLTPIDANDGGDDSEYWRDALREQACEFAERRGLRDGELARRSAGPVVHVDGRDVLFAEGYFYRRMVSAMGFFDPRSPLFQCDPFAAEKLRGLHGAVAMLYVYARRLDRLACAGGAQTRGACVAEVRHALLASLWGNRADLSLFPADAGAAAGHGDVDTLFVPLAGVQALVEADAQQPALLQHADDRLLVDDSARAAEWLVERARDGERPAVAMWLDNMGVELVADMAAADALVQAGVVSCVTFVVKAYPVFVSDVLARDIDSVVAFARARIGGAAAERWTRWLQSGTWRVVPHAFCSRTDTFDRLPAELASGALAPPCALVVVKGDANYRRLVLEREWPHDTPFADVVRRHWRATPAVLALRSCKSEIAVGVPGAVERAACARDPLWLTNGEWGVAQFR